MEQWKELSNIKTKVQQFIAYRSPIPKVHVGRINLKINNWCGKNAHVSIFAIMYIHVDE